MFDNVLFLINTSKVKYNAVMQSSIEYKNSFIITQQRSLLYVFKCFFIDNILKINVNS